MMEERGWGPGEREGERGRLGRGRTVMRSAPGSGIHCGVAAAAGAAAAAPPPKGFAMAAGCPNAPCAKGFAVVGAAAAGAPKPPPKLGAAWPKPLG